MSEGVKFDTKKVRYDLLAPEFLEGTAQVLTHGAEKYGDRNWELGMDWHRPFAALMRHMWAWWKGEDIDPESGLSHLSHAACNLQFLMAYSNRQIGKDNRNGTATSTRDVPVSSGDTKGSNQEPPDQGYESISPVFEGNKNGIKWGEFHNGDSIYYNPLSRAFIFEPREPSFPFNN